MNVIFDLKSHIVVNNQVDVGNVETTTCNVGRYQNSTASTLSEFCQDPVTLLLSFVAVYRCDLFHILFQKAR